jgi:hypothetical protein
MAVEAWSARRKLQLEPDRSITLEASLIARWLSELFGNFSPVDHKLIAICRKNSKGYAEGVQASLPLVLVTSTDERDHRNPAIIRKAEEPGLVLVWRTY